MAEGIEVRGNSIRVYFRFNGELYREKLELSATPENIAYAKRKVKVIELEIDDGCFDYARHFPNSQKALKNTFGHYAAIWAGIKVNQVAPSTMRGYDCILSKHILPRWGKTSADRIEHIGLQEWIQKELMPVLHNKTIREILCCMRQIFRLYRTRNKLSHDPTEGIDIRLPDDLEPDPFTRAEMDAIFATPTDHPQELNLIKFMMWTGARVSGALCLSWDDIDLESGVVTFRRSVVRNKYRVTKTRRSKRELQLLKPALEAVRAQALYTGAAPESEIEVLGRDNKTLRKEKHRFVFVNSTTGRPHYSDVNLRNFFFITHLKRAGVRYRGPGQCRHTFASQMLSSGEVTADWVADQLGHTTTAMVFKHYGKWINEDAKDFTGRLNAKLGL